MQCSKCGNSQVIIKKQQSGQYLCKDCFIESIEKKVIKTVKKEKLLDKGDKVLVALSGGKDSVTTLEILNSFRKMNVIDICAVTVDEGIDNYRQEGVDIAIRHAKRLGIEHKVVSLKEEYGITLDEIMQKDNHIGSCSYCGVFRRTIINKAAREMGATKIATGHNLDDEVQAIMMNYLEGNTDNLTKLGAKSSSKAKEFTVKIKPLRGIPAREIGLYVVAKELEVHFDSCPYAQQSFRGEVSDLINKLSEKHPTIKYSALRGYDKIKEAIGDGFKKTYPQSRCERCGEPSANRLCKACTFLEELENYTIKDLLNDLELSSQTIVPKQNGELVIEESEIHDDDEIRLIQIIYGG